MLPIEPSGATREAEKMPESATDHACGGPVGAPPLEVTMTPECDTTEGGEREATGLWASVHDAGADEFENWEGLVGGLGGCICPLSSAPINIIALSQLNPVCPVDSWSDL